MYFVDFFFSSRRRHTRCLSDWSSDVCSSDLYRYCEILLLHAAGQRATGCVYNTTTVNNCPRAKWRSEERRVGKECRFRWWPERYEKIETHNDDKLVEESYTNCTMCTG